MKDLCKKEGFLLLVSVLIMVAPVFASSEKCEGDLKKVAVLLSSVNPPRLQIDGDSIDFGQVPFNKHLEHTFRLKNSGRGPLFILETPEVKALEGC